MAISIGILKKSYGVSNINGINAFLDVYMYSAAGALGYKDDSEIIPKKELRNYKDVVYFNSYNTLLGKVE